MNREQKTALVEQLAEQIRAADAIFAVDYRGISVTEAAALRARLRESETRFRIVKNSLTERAADQAGTESLKDLLEGPTALAFVGGDAALAAKALNDAGRALGTLAFKGGLMEGTVLSGDDIRAIARLPARDVLHSQLVGTIAAPLTGLARGLNALIAGIAIQLQQIAEHGLVGAGSSSSSEAAESEGEAEQGDEAARAASEEDAGSPQEEAESPPEEEAEAPAEPEASAEPESESDASDDEAEARKEEQE